MLESLCVHGFPFDTSCFFPKKKKRDFVVARTKKFDDTKDDDTRCTVDIESPDVMDSFISNANLTKEDEQRLR